MAGTPQDHGASLQPPDSRPQRGERGRAARTHLRRALAFTAPPGGAPGRGSRILPPSRLPPSTVCSLLPALPPRGQRAAQPGEGCTEGPSQEKSLARLLPETEHILQGRSPLLSP